MNADSDRSFEQRIAARCRSYETVPESIRVDAARDVLAYVQAPVLHGCIETIFEWPRMHATLNILADRPVLAVDQVPKVHSI